MRSKVVLSLFLSVFLAGCTGKSQKREQMARGQAPTGGTSQTQTQAELIIEQEAEAEKLRQDLERIEAELAAARAATGTSATEIAQRDARIRGLQAELDAALVNQGVIVAQASQGGQGAQTGQGTVVAQGGQGAQAGQGAVVAQGGQGAQATQTTSDITNDQRDSVIAGIKTDDLWDFATLGEALVSDTATAAGSMFTNDLYNCESNKIHRLKIDGTKLSNIIRLLEGLNIEDQKDVFLYMVKYPFNGSASAGDLFLKSNELAETAKRNATANAENLVKSAILSLYLRTGNIGRDELVPVAQALGFQLEAGQLYAVQGATLADSRFYVKLNLETKSGSTCQTISSDLNAESVTPAQGTSNYFSEAIATVLDAANGGRAEADQFRPVKFLTMSQRVVVHMKLVSATTSLPIFSQAGSTENFLASLVATGNMGATANDAETKDVAKIGLMGAQLSRHEIVINHFNQTLSDNTPVNADRLVIALDENAGSDEVTPFEQRTVDGVKFSYWRKPAFRRTHAVSVLTDEQLRAVPAEFNEALLRRSLFTPANVTTEQLRQLNDVIDTALGE